ncbi:hypothetical protein JCM10212_000918 [Sporobolomyces blumeae]
MRELAQQHRTRPRKDGAPSQRASRSTLASFTSTGESVYEDAVEPESDSVEELDVEVLDSEPRGPAPLDSAILLDAPPEPFEVPSRSREVTPKPTSTNLLASPRSDALLLSPESIPPLDERAFYEQRQATLQAEAKRRSSVRQSVTSLPPSPASSSSVVPFRRHSGVPRMSTKPYHPRRASVALSVTSSSSNRLWHPKPLVLTPVRTIVTPLTNDSSLSASPRRRFSTLDDISTGGCRASSRASMLSDGSRAISPHSPDRPPFASRSISPLLSSPRQPGVIPGHARRRSLGYIDSQNDPLSTFGRRAIGYDRRMRCASEDTGYSRSLAGSAISRFTATTDGESPESSLSGWSEDHKMGKTSPLLSDREWEQQWLSNRFGGPATETVHDVREGRLLDIDDIAEEQEDGLDFANEGVEARGAGMRSRQQSERSDARRRHRTLSARSADGAASNDRNSTSTPRLIAPRPTSAAAVFSQHYASPRRDSIPPTPPPKTPLPRLPNQRPATSIARKRSRLRYEEQRNSRVRALSNGSSSSDAGEEFFSPSSRPAMQDQFDEELASLRRSMTTSQPGTPKSRRPIMIRPASTPDRRRSSGLSQIHSPPFVCSPTMPAVSVEAADTVAFEVSSSAEDEHPTHPPFDRLSQQSRTRNPSLSSHSSTVRSSIVPIQRPTSLGGRRLGLEPRDPRTREELDAGHGSYLDVLLNLEPPPRPISRISTLVDEPNSVSKRSSRASQQTLDIALNDAESPTFLLSPRSKSTGFRFFSGLRAKSPQPTENVPPTRSMRPIVIPPVASERASHNLKSRPSISGPLELYQAEVDQRRSHSSLGPRSGPDDLDRRFSSASRSTPHGQTLPIMQSFTSLVRVYDEQSADIRRRLSLKDSTLSLARTQSTSVVGDKSPPAPHKPARSPLRPTPNSINGLASRASFTSTQ